MTFCFLFQDFLVLPDDDQEENKSVGSTEPSLPSDEKNRQQSVRISGLTATWEDETRKDKKNDSETKRFKWLELLIGKEEDKDENEKKTESSGNGKGKSEKVCITI